METKTKAETEKKEGGPLTIVRLTASNVMRLKAVEIRPEGNAVIVEGKNTEGKTSVLRSIAMVFGGEKLCPERPIRDGETSAEVSADCGEFVVTRRWTSNDKSTLKVVHRDGFPIGSPQTFLAKLLGSLSFDPVAFATMDPPKRANVLREITGLDTRELDQQRKARYDSRTEVNRDLLRAQKEMEGLGPAPAKGGTTRPVEEITADRDAATAWNTDIDNAKKAIRAQKARIAELEDELGDERKKLVRIEKAAAQEVKDVEALTSELTAATAAGANAYKARRRGELTTEIAGFTDKAQALTNEMEALDAKKAAMIAGAKMPVKGLAVADDGSDVTFNEVPFSQASGAEKLRVSMAIGMAQNPRIRVILIEDGSLCDAESMAAIEAIAKKNGYQVWIERVADKPSKAENAVYIEDGEVSE